MAQAADYSSALHWMKAAAAAGTLDGDAVAEKMHAMPVDDFYHDNVPVQPNGQVQDPMHVWRVKPGAKSTHKWDFYEPIATIAGNQSYPPLNETGCSLVHT
jgi:branched-chain amino acid transport system substrate-binding protein